MDKKIPVLNNEIKLHYYKDEGVIYFEEECVQKTLKLSKLNTDIIELCNGKNNIKDICEVIIKTYEIEIDNRIEAEQLIKKFLLKLNKNQIIIFLDNINELYYSKLSITGVRKKAYPRNITLELTNKCNFRCGHCYKEADIKNDTFLNIESIKEIIDFFRGKSYRIELTGGEPLIHTNFREIIDYIGDDFKINLLTNGYLLNKIDSEILKKMSLVQVSLYGLNNFDYKYNTKVENGFDNVCKGLKKLKDNNIFTIVSIIVTNNNYYNLEEYIKVLINLGVDRVRFGKTSDLGRALNYGDENNSWKLDDFKLENIMNSMESLKQKYNKQIDIRSWNGEEILKLEEILNVNYEEFNYKCTCDAGTQSITISESEITRPCQLLPQNPFNLMHYKEYIELIKNGKGINFENKIRLYEEMATKGQIGLNQICSGFKLIKK